MSAGKMALLSGEDIDAIDNACNRLRKVVAYLEYGTKHAGGVFIDPKGLILTTFDFAMEYLSGDQESPIIVYNSSGSTFYAIVAIKDDVSRLALLKVIEANDFDYVKTGDKVVRADEDFFYFGHPRKQLFTYVEGTEYNHLSYHLLSY
ncbi:hypothetical protein Ancab_001228 [Ancistrocladus abbreviatus]